MKKIISLLIIASIFMSFSIINIAAEESTTIIASTESLDVLKAIGFIDAEKVIEPDKEVSRGELANLAMYLITRGNKIECDVAAFNDVDNNSLAYDAVNYLANLGVLSGYGDGTFRPDETIKYVDAVMVLVSSLFPEGVQDIKSNYPITHMNIATNLNFLKNIEGSSNSALTWKVAGELILNILNSNNFVENVFSGYVQYTKDKNETYLNAFFDIYKVSGVVTDNGVTSLSGKSKIKEDEISIGQMTFLKKSDADAKKIGKYVVAYYKKDDAYGKERIIYCEPVSRKNTTITIKASDIIKYSNNTYEYILDGDYEEIYSAKLQQGFDLIYNGKSPTDYSTLTSEMMVPESGYIELIDADDDSGYETVIIYSYRTIIVSVVDAINKIVYDKNGNDPLNLSDVDKEDYEIVDNEGHNYELSELVKWDVLSVAQSDDNKCFDIILNRQSIEGQISRIENDIYTLSEGKYKVSEAFRNKNLKVGEFSRFYLNYEGVIVASDPNFNPKGGFAYVMSLGKNGGNSLNEKLLIKLFDESGEIIAIPLAKKITVDGTEYTAKKYDDYKQFLTKLCDFDSNGDVINVQNQLICYGINGDEEVNYIDTSYDVAPERYESLDSLHMHGASTTDNMYYINRTFIGKILINEDTKVFLIPSDNDEESFAVTDYSHFRDGYYNINAYVTKDKKATAEAIVVTGNAGRDYSDIRNPIMLVEEVMTAIDKEGNVVQKLVGIENNKEVTYYTTEENVLEIEHNGVTIKINKGDIIRHGYNIDGRINAGNIQLLYDADNESYIPQRAGSYAGTAFMFHGKVYSFDDNVIRITDKPLDETTEKDLYNYVASSFKVYIVNQQNMRCNITKGTMADVVDYFNAREDCSDVYVYTTHAIPSMLVIYK